MRVFPQRFGHILDHTFGKIPEHIAVETNGAAGAFVLYQPALVHRQNLRMLFRQPDRGGRRRCGQHDFDAGLAEHVHDSLQPVKFVFAFDRLAESPGELTHPDDIDTGHLPDETAWGA